MTNSAASNCGDARILHSLNLRGFRPLPMPQNNRLILPRESGRLLGVASDACAYFWPFTGSEVGKQQGMESAHAVGCRRRGQAGNSGNPFGNEGVRRHSQLH
jgi:hypothetical protein